MPQSKIKKHSWRRLCARLHNRTADGHVATAISRENFPTECRRPRSRNTPGADFARACTIELHMDMLQEPFHVRIFRYDAADQDQGTFAAQTSREPAKSKCTWTCYKSHFMRESSGKMPEARWSTLLKHRSQPTIRTPSVWTHCFWEKKKLSSTRTISCPLLSSSDLENV